MLDEWRNHRRVCRLITWCHGLFGSLPLFRCHSNSSYRSVAPQWSWLSIYEGTDTMLRMNEEFNITNITTKAYPHFIATTASIISAAARLARDQLYCPATRPTFHANPTSLSDTVDAA